MRWLRIIKGRRIAKKGQTSMKDLKLLNNIRVVTVNLLSAVLSDMDAVMIEVSAEAVPFFMDVLDDPAFSAYTYMQLADDKYIFRNRTIIL